MLNYVLLRTGIKLHYAERGDPSGEPVVFLHGYADSWQSFAPMLSEFSYSFRTLTLDLRGHGNSDKPEGAYKLEDYVADLEAFMDSLGLGMADIVGHSLGSLVAQMFSAHHPDRIRRLLLLSSAPSAIDNAILRGLKEEVDSLNDPIDKAFVVTFQEPSSPIAQDFMNMIISESMKVPAHVWQKALSGLLQVDNSSILGCIKAPTFIAWGCKDTIFTREDQGKLIAKIPHALLREYDAGHAIHWEKPKELALDMMKFMTQTSPS
jgi:pimeloyl-ACP methyl ester carboxylesterase